MEDVNRKAVAEIFGHFEPKLYEWSKGVKIKGGWVCQTEGCGELDREMLESHHIKPRAMFPELMYDLDNGECLCLFCHAKAHEDNPVICNQILARLAILLYNRHCQHIGNHPCRPMAPPEGLLR